MFSLMKWFYVVATIALPARVCADAYIQVGTWNIEHLGRRFGQNPAALAQHIQLAGVDLLALQEIHDTDDSSTTITNGKLDKALELVSEQTGHEWRYVLHPERDGVTRNQHVGVAWNADKLTIVGDPYFIEVNYANDATWKRTPYAVKFKTENGKTDFVVIVLHMKSNIPLSGMPPPSKLRELEAAALIDQLPVVRQKFDNEQDIILIGDTNCKDDQEPALAKFKNAGFKDLNGHDAMTYRKVYQMNESMAPFDRILVPSRQSEFRFSHQYVLRPTDRDAHYNRFSDHWLVKVVFRVLNDDDP